MPLPEASEAGAAAYEADFYTWAQEQAMLLRADRLDEIDRFNIAEEIESLGRREFDKLVNAYRAIVLQMLLWDSDPGKQTRNRAIAIDQHRDQAAYVLSDNSGLNAHLDRALRRAYETARHEAAIAVDCNLSVFRKTCPYTLHDLIERPFPYE